MSFNKDQFRSLIDRVLRDIGLHSDAAVSLLLGTAAQESHFGTYLKQIKGPALGVFQMEPRTHNDHMVWLHQPKREALLGRIANWGYLTASDLEWNLAYAIAMCRVHYRRVISPLPPAGDVVALGQYWKRWYNTNAGKGTVEEFVNNYKRFVG